MEYPRADKAVSVDAETGARTEVAAGSTADALYYEMLDMEHAVQTRDASAMCLGYSRNVMDIMTRLRKEWGMKYPGEEWDEGGGASGTFEWHVCRNVPERSRPFPTGLFCKEQPT